MKVQIPAALTVEMNCLYPRWICSVSDNIGTANGGFWKGFKTHADMWTWLEKNGFEWNVAASSLTVTEGK